MLIENILAGAGDIVWRRSRPVTEKQVAWLEDILGTSLVRDHRNFLIANGVVHFDNAKIDKAEDLSEIVLGNDEKLDQIYGCEEIADIAEELFSTTRMIPLGITSYDRIVYYAPNKLGAMCLGFPDEITQLNSDGRVIAYKLLDLIKGLSAV